MRFKRSLCKCEKCALRDSTKVHGEGNFGTKIAFIGEAPGKLEDLKARPFVGPAGKFLSWGLGEAGIFRHQSWLMNVVSCRPPGNKIDSLEGLEGVKRCYRGFLEELEFLLSKGIKVLVPLGATASQALKIDGKITSVRGSVYERILCENSKGLFLHPKEHEEKLSPEIKKLGEFTVIPTLHPSFLVRYRAKRKDSSANLKYIWIADLRKAKEISEKGWDKLEEKFILKPTLKDLEDFLEAARRENQSLALDIETTGFSKEYAKIVVIGLARDKENAICVPLLKEHGQEYWSPKDKPKVLKLLNNAFREFKFIIQNSLFDVLFLQRKGFDFRWENLEHDTLLLHHTLSPELPHNLGFIVSVYGSTPYWKEEFLNRTISILEMPQLQMREYNLRDCVVLHQVVPEMLKDLEEEPSLKEVYQKEALPLLKPVGKMMLNGILFDPKKQRSLKKKYKKSSEELKDQLYKLGKLPPEFNIDSGDDLRYFLFGVEPEKFQKISELKDFELYKEIEVKCPACKKKSWLRESLAVPEAYCPKCENPDVSLTGKEREKSKRKTGTKVYEELLKLKIIKEKVQPLYRPKNFYGKSTSNGKISTAKDGLLSFQIKLQNRLEQIESFIHKDRYEEEVKQIEKTLEWLAIYNKWKALHKVENDFTNYTPDPDGRVRGNYLPTGTATGRLSMNSPNLQQVPKKLKDVREMFIAGEGKILVSGDYRNLEVFVLAYETGEPELIPVIEGKINQHDENTKALFRITPEHPMWGPARRGAKIFQFGRVQYGGGQRAIYEKVTLEAPELRLTFRQFVEAEKSYFEKYKVLHEWQEKVKDIARRERKSKTFLGRIRTLMGDIHDIEKQALNTPIQGGAAGVINRALIRLDFRLEKLASKAKLVLQVHDQLIYEVPIKELPTFIPLMKEEMERPLDFYGKLVSFPVDIEIGPNWGKLEEIEINDTKITYKKDGSPVEW